MASRSTVLRLDASETNSRLAVLIDAGNAQAAVNKSVLAEVACFGEATDSTLIVDAMDLLYTRKFEGLCLVTSGSDDTGLAMRLR